jgi:hypothetical protein
MNNFFLSSAWPDIWQNISQTSRGHCPGIAGNQSEMTKPFQSPPQVRHPLRAAWFHKSTGTNNAGLKFVFWYEKCDLL